MIDTPTAILAPLNQKRRASSLSGGSGRKKAKRPKENPPEAAVFPKLDLSNPDHARRSQQRLKAVSKGKNTPGYANYTKTIPQESRRLRSMETPMTPDHKADIPNKRWQGMLKAWRVALHQYDPKDLVTADAGINPSPKGATDRHAPSQTANDISPSTPTKDVDAMDEDDPGTPVSVLSHYSPRELQFQEELCEHGLEGDDSDDDLL